ncbi:MAG: glycosyltransferase family 9 protein [Acidobacteriota bacterium]|nr:glycosyltransferase family 9 protein [Acidobacteriota bacterium]
MLKKTSVLLVRPGGLGDLLVALPSIAFVREKMADARLTLACRVDYGRLFLEAGLVDDLVSVDSRNLSWLFAASAVAEADASAESGEPQLNVFSSIVGWMRKRGILDIPAAADGTGLRAVVAPDSEPDEAWSRFFLRRTLDLFGDPRPPEALLPRLGRLRISARMRTEGLSAFGFGNEPGDPVVVHTGSGSTRKRWPSEYFLEIMRRLSGAGRRGVCITGEAEAGSPADLDDGDMPPGWTRSRRPDILHLAGLLSGPGLFLGNDSGTAHLAAACGCSSLVLFLNEFATLWRPYGPARLISAPAMADISVDLAWEEILDIKQQAF